MAQNVNITIQDGALGTLPVPTDSLSCVLGTCSAGTSLQIFASADIKSIQSNFGQGPMVEAAAYELQTSGAPVLCVRLPTGTPGAAGTVTTVGTGTSVTTATGAAFDRYDVLFTVTTGGTIATAGIKFTVSLDNGISTNAEVALGTANTYLIPNTGITLNFAAGTLVAGDVVTFTTTPPLFSFTDVTSAFTLLDASPQEWGFVHLVGPVTGTQAGSIDGYMTNAQNQFRYAFALVEARDVNAMESEAAWLTSVETDFAGVDSKRVAVAAGHYIIPSPISGRFYRRPLAWAAAGRAKAVAISTDLGRVRDGGLSTVSLAPTSPANYPGVFHDERVTPSLDASRFISLRTLIGRAGVYILNPNVMVHAGSDFTLLQYRRVMDKACRVARASLLNFLSDSVRLTPATGHILEHDAVAIETIATSALYDSLVAPGDASSVQVVASRIDNLSVTKTLNVTIRVQPLGYLKDIEVDIAFTVAIRAAA